MLPRVASRVILRRLRAQDLDDFQAYRRDPEVGRYQGWSPMSAEGALRFLEEMSAVAVPRAGSWIQIAIAERETDRLIGDIGMCVHPGPGTHAELGYSLAAPWQRRGLATEAVGATVGMLFEGTDIGCIMATTDLRNEASIRLLLRLGMSLVSTQHARFRGEACVEQTFALERGAWHGLKAPVDRDGA